MIFRRLAESSDHFALNIQNQKQETFVTLLEVLLFGFFYSQAGFTVYQN